MEDDQEQDPLDEPPDEGCLEGNLEICLVNKLPWEPECGPSFKSLSRGLPV